ncbi:MAG: hypothetical protein R3C56_33655 [Pirellulaceae bacterium]
MANQLERGLLGHESHRYADWRNDQFEINVQYEKEHRNSLQDFADFQFMLAGGKQVPLGQCRRDLSIRLVTIACTGRMENRDADRQHGQ